MEGSIMDNRIIEQLEATYSEKIFKKKVRFSLNNREEFGIIRTSHRDGRRLAENRTN